MTVRRIHRWPIVTALGAGGMGRVYEVRDRAGAHWALKTLPHTWEPADAARLRREAELMARIDHPNVARVARAVLDHDPPYLLTELLTGPTLHERVTDDEALKPVEVVDIARGVARGLVALHDLGIVHRDLTPRNVILNPRGPCIIDFGVAYATDVTQLTQIDATPGTPAWMAPERAGGLPATAAADIYGWGRLVAYAATGQVNPDPMDIDEAALGSTLTDLTRRALSPDPQNRPTLVELATWAGPADQVLVTLPTPRPPRSRRHLFAGVGLTAVVALTAVGWTLLDSDSSEVSSGVTAPTQGGGAVLSTALSDLTTRGVPVPTDAELQLIGPAGNFADGTAYRFTATGTRTGFAAQLADGLRDAGWSGEFTDYTSPSITTPDGTPETTSDGYFRHPDGSEMFVVVTDDTSPGRVGVSVEVSGPPAS